MATTSMADDDAANALLDEHLLTYLHAYQEYTVLTIELQSVLREGHIKLAHARRELSRTTSTSALSFGTTCVPSEFQARLRVGLLAPPPDGQPDAPPVLELREGPFERRQPSKPSKSKGALAKEARAPSGEGGGGLRNRRQGGATAAGAGAAAAGATLPDLNDSAPGHEGEGEGSDDGDVCHRGLEPLTSRPQDRVEPS